MKLKPALLAVPACAVTTAALLATPASAATTFTVSPGGAWSGVQAPDSSIGIRDAVSNQVTLCTGLSASGGFRSGTGLSGAGIGSLTGIAFTGCVAERVPVTVSISTSAANPAPITFTQEFPVGSTTMVGQATNISVTLDDARGCHVVAGARAGGPGFTGLAYRSSDHRLSFDSGGKGLFVQSAAPPCDNGQAGLDIKPGERIDLGGFGDGILDSSILVTPAQTITSP